MKKVIVLAGGLGNQLFQLAAAEQIHINERYFIYTNKLDNYKTSRNPDSLLITKYQNRVLESSNFQRIILNSKFVPLIKSKFIKSLLVNIIGVDFLIGYFQDCVKFNKGILILKKIIEKENKLLLKDLKNKFNINNKSSVAIHLRFGDYVKDGTFWLINENFIEKSLQKFQNIDELMVFCEEIPTNFTKIFRKYCKNIKFSKDLMLNDHEEFLLMATYSNLIISNSTFSFWASIINNSSKKVYGPDKFFNSKSNKQWIKNCQKMNIDLIRC